jgi:hypothetical protein
VLKVTPTSWALVGGMLPVSKTPGSVAVWAIVSLFNQFTVCPTLTVTGLGEYTPFAIVTVSTLGGFTHSGFVGVGVHGAVGLVVLVVLDELPHPPPSRMRPTKATRVVGAAGRGRLNDISTTPSLTVTRARDVPTVGIAPVTNALAGAAQQRQDRLIAPTTRWP